MRVNIYNEELTDEVEVVWTEAKTGKRFCGLRFFLKSHPDLHHAEGDDDRSAVTLWAGSTNRARKLLQNALDELIQSEE